MHRDDVEQQVPGQVPLAVQGQLRPDGPFSMARASLGTELTELARQVWIPRWSLPHGAVHLQPVLNYPALNVAVEPTTAAIHFPSPGLVERELRGDGWAAGVLLRPGAGWLVAPVDHSTHLGSEIELETRRDPADAELVAGVRAAIAADDPAGDHVDRVVASYRAWMLPLLDRVDDRVVLVNAICDAAESGVDDSGVEVRSPADLQDRFDISERSLQRLLRTRIGLSPSWLFQRRRLHEAAARIRDEPDLNLAAIAAELGYADQAHFTRDFRAVVGQSPGRYRSDRRRDHATNSDDDRASRAS